MGKWFDRGVSLFEYFIAFLFLRGAYNVWDAEAVDPEIGLLDPLTSRAAIVTYAGIFLVLGLGLIVAKLFRRRRFHGWVLQAMYLVAFYIVSLSLLVNGWKDSLIFSIFITLSIGAVYIYWRYKVLFNKLEVETDRRTVPPC